MADITTGLVAHFTMDADVATLPDQTVNGNDFTREVAMTETTGVISGALRSNANNEGYYRTDNMGMTYDMAISCFIKFNALGTDATHRPIIGFTNNAANSGLGFCRRNGGRRIHIFRGEAGGTRLITIHDYNNSAYGWLPASYDGSTWYHIVIQQKSGSTNYEIWIDKVKTVDQSWVGDGSKNMDHKSEIACYGHSTALDVELDHIKIFDLSSRAALTTADITALYEEGYPPAAPGLSINGTAMSSMTSWNGVAVGNISTINGVG